MAVIALSLFRRALRFLLASGLFIAAVNVKADQSAGIREQLGVIANALSAGNPEAAMMPFSKSYTDYDKLRNYFSGLTSAFTIANEVDVTDENDSTNESTLTIHWALTVSNSRGPETAPSDINQRAADIHARFVRQKGKWKIVEFSPIDLFDPSQAQKTGQQ